MRAVCSSTRASAGGFVTDPTLWSQGRPGVAGVVETGAPSVRRWWLGRVLARSSRDDLVVGVPGEDVSGAVDVGTVQVLYGAGTSFSTTSDQQFEMDDFDLGSSRHHLYGGLERRLR